MQDSTGTLFIIPSSLGEDAPPFLSSEGLDILDRLHIFITERARTSRRWIKSVFPEKNISELEVVELEKKSDFIPEQLLKKLLDGKDIGLLSEAGAPGIADPGARIVAWAHRHNVQVRPIPGPSSIPLALMASGFNGQKFAFHGYLPRNRNRLASALLRMERESERQDMTQIFIETPYRNEQFLEVALDKLKGDTSLCIAMDLTLPDEWIRSMPVSQWQHLQMPDIHKRPAIFLLYREKPAMRKMKKKK